MSCCNNGIIIMTPEGVIKDLLIFSSFLFHIGVGSPAPFGVFVMIDILGTPYTLKIVPRVDDPGLSGDGYVDTSIKEIVVDDMAQARHDYCSKKNLEAYQMEVVRHEIVHAMLHESGLDYESWGKSEEIVDWIALQFPKIARAVAQAEIEMGAIDISKLP